MGTGLLTALLSSVMNNMPTVLVGALAIERHRRHGAVREAMIYANVIGCDLGRRSRRSAASPRCCGCMCWSRRASTSRWGYYFKVGVVLTVPVLLLTLAALALRLN